jgi:hypothetical protein
MTSLADNWLSEPDSYKRNKTKLKKESTVSSQDCRQIIFGLFGLAVECFKALMACLLVIFVPQHCRDYANPADIQGHICDPGDNFQGLNADNVFVVIWNFLTLFGVLVHYGGVWKRERYLIEYLDVDPDAPQSALATVLPKYPGIQSGLLFYNQWVFGTSVLCVVLLIVNVISSGVIIFRDYYSGWISSVVFVTNILLLGGVVWKALQSTYFGMRTGRAYAILQVEPVIFNAIDPDHLHKDEEKALNPKLPEEKKESK